MSSSRTRLRTIIFVIVATMVSGAVLHRSDHVSGTREASAEDSGGGKTRKPPAVAVMKPYRADVQRMTRVLAHVEPYREALVYSMVTGIVLPDPIEEGTRVDPNGATRILCRLDVPNLDADVATAKSQAARATALRAQVAAGVAQARQGVLQARASARKAAGMVLASQADRDKARAEMTYRAVVHNRLAGVRQKSPNVISQDEVDEAKGKLDIAKAELAVAEVGIELAHEEVKVAEAKFVAAEANVTAAEAATKAAEAEEAVAAARVAEAEVTLSFATITTPIKGVVTARMIDTGSLVKDGGRNSGAEPLFRVVDDDKLRIWFSLAAVDAPSCRPGNKVIVVIEDVADPATGKRPFKLEATVTRITDALDPSTRSMKAEVVIDNPPGLDGNRLLRAGMFARAEVSLDVHRNALLLPTRAVATRKHKSSVMVVRPDGTVNKISVEIGVDDGVQIEVLSGVTETDVVIIKGMGLVADGEKATPNEVKPGENG